MSPPQHVRMALLAPAVHESEVAVPSPPPGPSPGPRFLLYSHDGVGLGHARRNLNLAAALTAQCPDASVLVATGAEDLDLFRPAGTIDVLRLPGIQKLGADRYGARRLPVHESVVHDLRAGLLKAAVERFQPDVVVADKHPGGLNGELVPALEAQRAAGGRAALGLRDVLDEPAQVQRDWQCSGGAGHVERLHDLVLVYGQRDILDPIAQGGLPAVVAERAWYCGYVTDVVHLHEPPGRRERPLVVGTAGGGSDGAPLLRALLQAARGARWELHVVTGPQLVTAERTDLEMLAARSGARVSTLVQRLGDRVADADALVCMGGYNSLTEAMAAAVPTVCVPRVSPRREQLVRVRGFADRGLVRMLAPERLTAGELREQVELAVRTDRAALTARIRATVDLGGARRAATVMLELAASARVARRAVNK